MMNFFSFVVFYIFLIFLSLLICNTEKKIERCLNQIIINNEQIKIIKKKMEKVRKK